MDNKPIVSVLMAVYNCEEFISIAIESVLASTYTNFELIIVDDISPDSSFSIAKSYALKDDRIKVYQNESNLGDYPNRNKAASYATGKYIKYVDHDDYIYPWGLSLLVKMMEDNPQADWGLCSLGQYVKNPFPFLLNPAETYNYNYFVSGIFHKAPLSSIIKTTIFHKAGGFRGIRMAGDFEMWHRLALYYNVLLMPDGIVWYREHANQESKKIKKFQFTYDKIEVEYLCHQDCPLSKDEVKKICRKNIRLNFIYLIRNMIKLNFDLCIFSIKRIRLYMKYI
ncbi:MAG TPA: glycosyltransferase [Ferruginibacter sp.]|jgi:glycosyltransferase involved in cell wall biosynthesis|nr:glycosyltransferase [Ferruginibacter sp.]